MNITGHGGRNNRISRRWKDLPRFHSFRCAVLGLERMTGERPLRTLDTKKIERFLQKFAPSTQKVYRQGLRFYYGSKAKSDFSRWQIDEEFNHIKIPKAAWTLDKEKYASIEELERIAAACSPRMGLIIMGLFWTGCRISEFINIRVDDCTVEGTRVRVIVCGKTGERAVFMPTNIYYDLVRNLSGIYLVEKRGGGKTNRHTVGDDMRRMSARVRAIHPHLIRHSRAMDLLQRGTHVDAVARYLGHADPATTLRYYLHSDMPNDKKQGIDRAGDSQARIDALRRRYKYGRTTWRRREKVRGSSRKGPVRG